LGIAIFIVLSDAEYNAHDIAIPVGVIFSFQQEVAVFSPSHCQTTEVIIADEDWIPACAGMTLEMRE